jgi:restriction system protein
MYEIRVQHPGLKAFRVIRDFNKEIAELRAKLQIEAWEQRWNRVQATDAKRREKQQISWDNDANKRVAQSKTSDCQQAISEIETLLKDSIELDHRVDWDSLKDRTRFDVPRPTTPPLREMPPAPMSQSFDPKFSLADYLLPPLKQRKRQQAQERFDEAKRQWANAKEGTEVENATLTSGYEKAAKAWELQRSAYLTRQSAQHKDIDAKRERYLAKESAGLQDYWEIVLTNAVYPDSFPKSFLLEYLSDSRLLIVDYALPSITCLPSIKEVKFVQVRKAFQEVPVTQTWLNKAYDEALYQISLRTLYELFQSDDADALQTIVFNGWVESVDKATGQDVNACVLSMQVNKAEFLAINLAQVEPKACFKKLKGISAAKLTELTPVRPILQINRDDKRFITPRDIIDSLDATANIAAMDWQDFENLIREIFEKEFSQNGGEVKITQASRDGGVDAVAFDPDPIRGGKIVIQAKRYTNTVSVSAVRDLYGTVMNEGAMKGILVTTADYGRDAFDFAKDKPLTLISGNELLYLLQKHGHRVKIDLQEARKLAASV